MVPSQLSAAPATEVAQTSARRSWRAILTPALLLLGPVLHVFQSHGYPLFRAEVALVAAVAAIVGLLAGIAIERSQPKVHAVALGVLLAVVVDLYLVGGSLRSAVIILLATVGIAWLLRTHIATIAFAVSIPVLLSTLLPPVRPVAMAHEAWPLATANRALPPVFHFILDEHGGVAGLAGDTALVRDMTAWYDARGFRLFSHAYSPYFDTYNAVPNLVNLTTRRMDASYGGDTTGSIPPLREIRYFDAMRAKGYGIRVFQSDYLDFCRQSVPSVQSCLTYPVNSLSYAADMPLPLPARVRIAGSYILTGQSYFFNRALAVYHRHVRPGLVALGAPAPPREWGGSRVTPPIGQILGHIERQAAQGAGGQLFFAHLMMPHYPYQYDSECRVHERLADRLDRISPNAPPGALNTDATRERRIQLYGGQVRCLMREVNTFFTRLDSLGVYDSAIIILQGDHGSRIIIRRPAGRAVIAQLTAQDILDGFSTLLAVKGPGISIGLDTTTLGISDALATLVSTDFSAAAIASAARPKPELLLVNTHRGHMIPIDYGMPAREVRKGSAARAQR